MRHAASFDHGFMNTTSPLRSFTAPIAHHHQQQHDFYSPQQPHHHHHQDQNHHHQVVQPSSAFEILAAKVSGQQQSVQQQQPVMDKTVRRLFTAADTSSEVPSSQPPHSESAVPTSLQSIFSQVSTSTADSTTTNSSAPLAATTSNGVTGSDNLPLTVISLEQVEKQLVADVPSPVSINPLTLFSGGGSSSGVSSTAPSMSTQPTASSTDIPATAKSHEASQQQHHVLLQPSAFMPSTIANGGAIHVVANPNPSVSSVAISIEPPSPVVAPGPIFASSGGGGGSTPSSNMKAQLLPENATPPSAVGAALQDQFFPPIPPIMHSPGMRAAPVSRVNQPQRQSRGEPSSLVSTTISAPHVAQMSAAVSRGAGKSSQQISSSVEEQRPPQSTPQRHSSQSTPSVSHHH